VGGCVQGFIIVLRSIEILWLLMAVVNSVGGCETPTEFFAVIHVEVVTERNHFNIAL